MTTITFDKTWSVDECISADVGAEADNTKELLYNIKRLMCLHGWTVIAASDGVNASAGTTYDWTSRAKIVGATTGTAHSWIVLQNTAIATTFQVCFDMNSATIGYMTCVVSYSGAFTNFTSTLNRPTASDEAVIHTGAAWCYFGGLDNPWSITMYYSSDNKCNRIYFSPVSILYPYPGYGGFFLFDSPKDPVSWWDEPWVAGVKHTDTSYSALCSVTVNNKLFTRVNGTLCNLAWATYGPGPAYGTTAPGNGQDYNGSYILSPISLVSLTVSRSGIFGSMFDLYWAGDGVPHGTYIPTSAGSRRIFTYSYLAQANDGNRRAQ
jgi:hypothetical protein